MKILIAMIILLTSLISGCTKPERTDTHSLRLVTQITADCSGGNVSLHRSYTANEKMEAVLNYLRCLDKQEIGRDIPTLPDQQITITLTYSDGTTRQYLQQSEEYLFDGQCTWYQIRQEQGMELAILLKLMESD